MSFGLYTHIPFCASRCPYCDFAFVVRKTHLAARYTDALLREFHARKPGACPAFDTVYFGGGTPSEVPAELLGRLLEAARANASIAPGAEITAEANPENRASFAALRKLGINRLSLGVQALEDRALKALGRRHTAAGARAAVEAARRAGFTNLNIDLIFGGPGQTVAGWLNTLDRALALGPEHLSVYGLTVEPGTAFHRRFRKGRLPLPPENEQAAMYTAALDRMEAAGYVQYEISNFARPGFACRHNLACWERQPYLGLGLSAHSFLNGRRSWNIRDLMAYIERVEATGSAVEGEEEISEEGRVLEEVLLGLRRPEGIPERLVSGVRADRLLETRMLERAGARLRLTRQGLLLADLVCAELLGEG